MVAFRDPERSGLLVRDRKREKPSFAGRQN